MNTTIPAFGPLHVIPEAEQEVYRQQGYRDREHYLATLCEEYGSAKVYVLAQLLGPSEDFDGLVTALEDDADAGFWEE